MQIGNYYRFKHNLTSIFRNCLIGWRGARRRKTRRSGWRTRPSRGTTTTNNPPTANYMSVDRLSYLFLPSATKLQRLCFFTCLSVHRRSTWAGTPLRPGTPPGPGTPRARYTPTPSGQVPPPDQAHPPGPGTPPDQAHSPDLVQPPARYTPRTRFIPRDQVHPGTRYTPQDTATVEDGMHPTGMHSCYFIFCAHFQYFLYVQSFL